MKFKSSYTTISDDGDGDLEGEMLDALTKEIQKEVDAEIMWKMKVASLRAEGWHGVALESLKSNRNAIDIKSWLKENVQNPYESYGREFIFKDRNDASFFLLRWS